MKAAVTSGLEEEGFEVLTASASPLWTHDESAKAFVLILRQGYTVVRTWPEHKHCSFDIHLWESLDKHQLAKKTLITYDEDYDGGVHDDDGKIVLKKALDLKSISDTDMQPVSVNQIEHSLKKALSLMKGEDTTNADVYSALRDDQPRGRGNVINFSHDIDSGIDPGGHKTFYFPTFGGVR